MDILGNYYLKNYTNVSDNMRINKVSHFAEKFGRASFKEYFWNILI